MAAAFNKFNNDAIKVNVEDDNTTPDTLRTPVNNDTPPASPEPAPAQPPADSKAAVPPKPASTA